MRSVITGQQVSDEKKQRARQMREAMTPAEAALWEYLRLDKLGVHFRRQQIIDGFIVDFYCPLGETGDRGGWADSRAAARV